MSLPLDHVVIAILDLEAAIADYTALGFQVLRGGDHPGRPTHNALVVFADGSYLELIAWKSPAPQERWWPLLQRHGNRAPRPRRKVQPLPTKRRRTRHGRGPWRRCAARRCWR